MDACPLKHIKSKYILKHVADCIKKNKFLKIIKYNKLIQKKLDIDLYDYKNYYEEIEIELIPIMKEFQNFFINIREGIWHYYHIYFNDNEKEIKRNYFTKKDNVSKIKIIIDNEIKSFKKLFYNCKCISKIKFIKFIRNDIIDIVM